MSVRMSPTWARGEAALRRGVAAYRRMEPGPGLVRLTVLTLGAAAMIVTLPGQLRGSAWSYLILVLLAVMPAVRPTSPWVTAVELVVVGEWLLAEVLYHQTFGPVGVFGTAALLYAHHSAAALAAALPLSARLAPGVLLGWLGRTGGVVLASVLLMLVVMAALPAAGTGRSLAAVPFLGLLAAVGAGVTLAWLLYRRR